MVLSCVVLRGLGRCAGGEYKAEVHVVSSDPREYDVSVTSTTYPVVAKDTRETAESRRSPSPSPSPSASSRAFGTHDCHSDSSSTQEHAPPTKDSTLVQIVTSPKDRSAPCCIHNTAACKVDGSSPSPAPPAKGSPFHRTSLDPPNNAARETREIRNNSREINKNSFPSQTQTSGGVTFPTPAIQVPQTHAGGHTRPRDIHTSEAQTGYTPARQVKTNQTTWEDKMMSAGKMESFLTNQTVNLQNASNNRFTIILQSPHQQAAASQPLDNYTRAFQHALINQSATIQPKLTNQTASQQVPTIQTGTFQHTPTHQAGNASLPKILQSAAIQQTAQEDPISETGDTQQDQIEQSGAIQQVASQTSPGGAAITQAVPNQTSTPQQTLVSPPQVTVPPSSPLQALQVPPNTAQGTETLPTPPQATVPPASTPEGTQAPPSSPQTPQIPPALMQAPPNQTEAAQQAAANQPETSPGDTSNLTNTMLIPSATGTGTARSIEGARNKSHGGLSQRRKKIQGRGFANARKRGSLRKVSEVCPCAGKVMQRMTTCKKSCTRNDDLLWKLLCIAFVIWVVYVLILLYVHRWFRRWLL